MTEFGSILEKYISFINKKVSHPQVVLAELWSHIEECDEDVVK